MSKIMTGEGPLQALSFSIQVSDRTRCNACCKFCISRTTPNSNVEKEGDVSWCNRERLKVGLGFAHRIGATHAILTGKADPLQEYHGYLAEIISTSCCFLPLVDIHTNGLGFALHSNRFLLAALVEAGLTNITFSIASFQEQINQHLMGIKKIPSEAITASIGLGLFVRCSLVLCREGVSSFDEVMDYIMTAGNLGVHSVVIREIWRPNRMFGEHLDIYQYNQNNYVDLGGVMKTFDSLSTGYNQYGISKRDPLPWGTPVYVVDGVFKDPHHGVNVTFARCDEATTGRVIKSVIHKPNGHGYRNWDSNGDILY